MIILVKKYWKYLLAILGVILAFILFILFYGPKRKSDGSDDTSKTTLNGILRETSSKLTEVKHVADIEAVIAKTKEAAVREELEEIKKTEDAVERRKQLLFLHNRVRSS